MGKAGFVHIAGASIRTTENSVLIFARHAFVPRTYPKLRMEVRHRLLFTHPKGVPVYGVCVSKNKAKACLFEFLATGRHQPAEEDYLMTGEFNTQPNL